MLDGVVELVRERDRARGRARERRRACLRRARLVPQLVHGAFGDGLHEAVGDLSDAPVLRRHGERAAPRDDRFAQLVRFRRLAAADHEKQKERDAPVHYRESGRATRTWFCTSRTPFTDSMTSSARRFMSRSRTVPLIVTIES